jgi:hypothetical protein
MTLTSCDLEQSFLVKELLNQDSPKDRLHLKERTVMEGVRACPSFRRLVYSCCSSDPRLLGVWLLTRAFFLIFCMAPYLPHHHWAAYPASGLGVFLTGNLTCPHFQEDGSRVKEKVSCIQSIWPGGPFLVPHQILWEFSSVGWCVWPKTGKISSSIQMHIKSHALRMKRWLQLGFIFEADILNIY